MRVIASASPTCHDSNADRKNKTTARLYNVHKAYILFDYHTVNNETPTLSQYLSEHQIARCFSQRSEFKILAMFYRSHENMAKSSVAAVLTSGAELRFAALTFAAAANATRRGIPRNCEELGVCRKAPNAFE